MRRNSVVGSKGCGAFYGLAVWGAYAAVEIADCSLVPIVAGARDLMAPSHWKFIAILVAAYSFAGLALGGLAAILLAAVLRRRTMPISSLQLQAAASVTLVLAFIANFVLNGGPKLRMAGIFALLLFTVEGSVLLWPRRLQRLACLSDPWTAPLLLLSLPLYLFSGTLPSAAFLAVTAAVIVISHRFLTPAGEEPRMPGRQLAALAVIILAVLLVTGAATREIGSLPELANRSGANLPNIFVLVLDTVRADHMSVYGYARDTTPRLREAAAQATTYTRAMSTSNWTLPTHASLFTGLYPRRHGAANLPAGSDSVALAPKYETLAERLSTAGYLNMAVIANTGIVRPKFGLDQGFHLFDVRDLAPCFQRGEHLRHGVRRLLNLLIPTSEFDQYTRRAERLHRDALGLIGKAKERGGPFFLFLNYMDAHEPYVPPPPFNTLFPGRDPRITPAWFRSMRAEVVSQQRRMSQMERDHFMSQYDGGIAYMDHRIGEFFDRLKEQGLYDGSLIVVTADHGEALGEKNFVAHAEALYENQLGIPLIIKYPHQRQGRTDGSLVSLVDLMPTILEAAGLEKPAGIDGRSLLSADGERRVFSEATVDSQLASFRPRHPKRQFAIFERNLKLISSSDGKIELYDLSLDPSESRDLKMANGEEAKRLQAALDDWLENPTEARVPERLDPATIERLKALGYVR